MCPLVAVLPAMTAIFGYSKTNAAQRPRAVVSDAALDDLVEFAAIEPDPTTLRAIVDLDALPLAHDEIRSEEHTSELQSLMRNSYAVFCLEKKLITPSHDQQLK